MYLQFTSFLHTYMTQVVEIFLRVRQELTFYTEPISSVPMSDDARNQGISSHDIDTAGPEWFDPRMLKSW